MTTELNLTETAHFQRLVEEQYGSSTFWRHDRLCQVEFCDLVEVNAGGSVRILKP